MSDQEEVKTEEQPAAAETEAVASESEQKPDTSQGESPVETAPSTAETETAADQTEQPETEQATTEQETEQAPKEAEPVAKETESQQEAEPAAKEAEKEPAQEEAEPAAKEAEKEPAQEEAEPAAKETEEPPSKEAEQEPSGEQAVEEEEAEDEEPDDGIPIALVSGASGFIATHVIKQLLEGGRYRVRGTVRNKKREDKVKPLLNLVPGAKYPLRLVEADLSKPETWKKAVSRCTYVFHVASPFPAGKANEATIVRTAVEGTTNVLQACADAGTVKRVVVTSSIAAISCGIGGNPENPPDHVYTEKDWSPESACAPYEKSKLKAEEAAWEFVKKLEESKRFELSVVNPAYVQGPLLGANSGEGSKEFAQRLLNGKLPAIPDVASPIVDVRDVAAAHIAAMEKNEAAGNRYILTNRTVAFKEMAQIIDTEFRPQGYKISTKNLPKVVMWVGKFFDSGIKQLYANLGKNVKMSNERMINELGVQPRPIEESVLDTCYSLIELGLARKTPGYLGHPSTRPPPPDQASGAKDEGQEPTTSGSENQTEAKPGETEETSEADGEKGSTSEVAGTAGEQDKPVQEEKESKEE